MVAAAGEMLTWTLVKKCCRVFPMLGVFRRSPYSSRTLQKSSGAVFSQRLAAMVGAVYLNINGWAVRPD
jgi:hypothetical protein